MKYLCLRNCYTGEQLYYGGTVYDLPDAMRKSEKNFRPLSADAVVAEPEVVEVITPVAEEPGEGPPLAGETVEVAPLYLSDKPPKSKVRKKKNGR